VPLWIALPAPPTPRVAGLTLDAFWALRLEDLGITAADTPGGAPWIDGRFAGLPDDWLRQIASGEVLLARPSAGASPSPERIGGLEGAAVRPLPRGTAIALGEPGGLAAAERIAWAVSARRLVQRGVVVVDPDRLICDPSVVVHAGARLWPDVVLRGCTTVGAGAEIRPGCWIEDTEIGEGVTLLPHCVCTGAVVGAGSQVGPMAHLRPGAHLSGDNKVGNFVEVKQATLGRGAKASHLSYLGDATVGDGANIGAGTITCNYDGHGKHPTHIGARAFIGSNSSLVAPVTIGEGAIVGAGSVLTRDVPADGLGVERGELKVLPGAGRKLNERNARRAAARKRGEE